MENLEKKLSHLKNKIRSQERLDMDSRYCAQYRREHNNKCTGCESWNGCNKLLSLGIVLKTTLVAKKSFGEEATRTPAFKLAKAIWESEMTEKILKSKDGRI